MKWVYLPTEILKIFPLLSHRLSASDFKALCLFNKATPTDDLNEGDYLHCMCEWIVVKRVLSTQMPEQCQTDIDW